MTRTTYLCRILHRPASRAHVMINGVGVYNRAPEKNVGPVFTVTHWLRPGENLLSVDLEPAPRSPLTPLMDAWFVAQIVTAEDQEKPLWSWEYPADVLSLGLPIELPRAHEGAFLVAEDLPKAAYLDAIPQDFPPEGTPAQHAAVRDLYDAFATRDVARFEAAMALKATEHDRFYTPSPLSKAEATARVNSPWVMEPFETADLRFDRYAGGRVAYVRRESGKAPVRAVHRDEPYLGFGTDFYMTFLDGRWQILW
jgi:hypothetical protein